MDFQKNFSLYTKKLETSQQKQADCSDITANYIKCVCFVSAKQQKQLTMIKSNDDDNNEDVDDIENKNLKVERL